jgi:broad specificity phosphatase PhoE
MRKTMRILLIRHGNSEGNVDEAAYAAYGDPRVPLTETGGLQAHMAGRFVKKYSQANGIEQWSPVFVSSFLRPQQTLSAIFKAAGRGLFPEKPYEDPRLTEQSFGFISYAASQKGFFPKILSKLLIAFSRAVYADNPYSAKPLFGESPKEIAAHTKTFIDGTLQRDLAQGHENIMIVSHGAVMKAFLMSWFHLPMSAWQDLETPGNCDCYVIEGEPGNWRVRKIYDGETFEECDIDLIEHIKYPTWESLPPAPDALVPKDA